MSQDRPSVLAMLSMERIMIEYTINFNDKVIVKFVNYITGCS